MPRFWRLGAPALLALGLAACNGKGEDTAFTSTIDGDGDGYAPADGDCDDENPDVNPGVAEVICDGLDNDCVDGDLDDVDGDGYACQAAGGRDCDDQDSSIHPDAEDACGDKIDSDCGGELECDCDDDGYDGEQCSGSDCDDQDKDVNPGEDDVCYDGVDYDCSGGDDSDCDGDGAISADYGGDDCDDGDPEIYPGATEASYDDIDNDCDDTTSDCDCDGDGYASTECGGDDCDDEDADVAPGADEGTVDGLDNDCDGVTDEDAYCNLYYPLGNGASALWVYLTNMAGTDYTEQVRISSYDTTTGKADLARTFVDAIGSLDVEETVVCADGVVTVAGWAADTSGLPLMDVTYTDPRTALVAPDDLEAGASWDFEYNAKAAAGGTEYTSVGTVTILSTTETVDVIAGTFEDCVLAETTYVIKSGTGTTYDREGTIWTYYAPYLGVVYAEDTLADGTTNMLRELDSYSGFYP